MIFQYNYKFKIVEMEMEILLTTQYINHLNILTL